MWRACSRSHRTRRLADRAPLPRPVRGQLHRRRYSRTQGRDLYGLTTGPARTNGGCPCRCSSRRRHRTPARPPTGSRPACEAWCRSGGPGCRVRDHRDAGSPRSPPDRRRVRIGPRFILSPLLPRPLDVVLALAIDVHGPPSVSSAAAVSGFFSVSESRGLRRALVGRALGPVWTRAVYASAEPREVKGATG